MYHVLGHDRASAFERMGCIHNGLMNMTYIALKFSRFVNGVAMQHGKVSQQMFPDYKVHSITNGVHAATWLSRSFQELSTPRFPTGAPTTGTSALSMASPRRSSPMLTSRAKLSLLRTVAKRTGQKLNPTVLTLGYRSPGRDL